MTFSSTEIVLAAAVTLLILTAARLLFLGRRLRRQQTELATAVRSLADADREIAELRQVEQRFKNFKADLKGAELATKMQKPRLERGAEGRLAAELPERYRYLHSLAEKGMPSSEIASILAISRQEADQLVALANLRRD